MACSGWKQRVIYILKLMVCASLMSCSALEFTCNDRGAAEIGSTAKLNCSSKGLTTLFYYSPDDKEVAYCLMKKDCGTEDDRYNATFVNTTSTQLSIASVQTSDVGNWTCRDVNTAIRVSCIFTAMKTPNCNITSDNKTDALDVNGEITLSVNVTNYYCSWPTELLLKTGNCTVELISNHTVETVTSDVYNSTFKVTESHIGYLELYFTCNNVIKRMPCQGVTALLERLPSCTIHSDKDTNDLVSGEELSLTVYTKVRNCSWNTGYQLQTGKLNKFLSGTYKETVTFRLKPSHFGSVYLIFDCNDISRKVQCGGIKELTASQSSLNVDVLHWTIAVLSVIGIVIAIVMIALKNGPQCFKTKTEMVPNVIYESVDLNKQVLQSPGQNPAENRATSISEESPYSLAVS